MLILCFVLGDVKLDRFLKWYLVYLFFYALSNIVTGHTGELLMKLAGTYLAAIVLYVSTKNMVLKFNGGLWVADTILVVAVLDAIVTIGQFYGNPLALTITDILRVSNLTEESLETYARLDTLHGRTVGGLLGEVMNGYYLSAACVLALYNRGERIRIQNWALCVFLLFALFLTQERSGLFVGTLCVVIYVIVSGRGKGSVWRYLVILALIVILALQYGGQFVSLSEMRYSEIGLDEGGRSNLSKGAWTFVAEYPLGGEIEFHSQEMRDPHNVLANSYLFGGIIGGTVVFSIILIQLITIFKIIYKKLVRKTIDNMLVVFSLLYLTYTFNSFFHNPSLPAGSSLFFVSWGMVSALLGAEKKQ